MSIGMKRGTVYLEEHQVEWEENAKDIINFCAALEINIVYLNHLKTAPISELIQIVLSKFLNNFFIYLNF